MKTKTKISIYILLITFFILFIFKFNSFKYVNTNKIKGILKMTNAVETQIINEEELSSNIPQIHSEAAIMYEINTGNIIYEKNSDEILYPASTTKIMTAILAVENCNLDDLATVSENAVKSVPSGYTNAKLIPGETISIKDLLYGLMLNSANEAANVLAEHISRIS